MNKILTLAALAALVSGCASINKNDGGNSNLKPRVINDSVHVKYEVDSARVKGTDQVKCLFGFICWGSTGHTCDQGEFGLGANAVVKNGAYANACDAANCDHLVGARYSIYTDDYIVYKKVKAEVSGFPARAVSAEVIDGTKCPAGCRK